MRQIGPKIYSTKSNEGVNPTVWSYAILICGLCKIKMVDETMNLFKKMHCKNMVLD